MEVSRSKGLELAGFGSWAIVPPRASRNNPLPDKLTVSHGKRPMSGNFLEYLADLAVFAKVVETKGFSAAARHIGLTKSSVSKQVSRREQGLGVRLLHRTTRALSLTEAGRVLYEGAAQSVSLAEEAQAAVAQLSVAPRGTLRITTSVAFGKLCVAPLIPEFLATYPEVRIQLVLLDRIVDLAEEGFDLAIR